MGDQNSRHQAQEKSIDDNTNRQGTLKRSVCYHEHALWGPGSEAEESAKHWEDCVKNPGHKTFIPVGEFGKQHLPVEWQTEDFIRYIKTWSDSVVRLRVTYTSPARLDQSGFYNPGHGGQRVGTGFVHWVGPTPGHCPCLDCKRHPGGQGRRSWTFHLSTAKHVVNDDSEVESVRVDFFHDYTGNSSKMKTLRGVKVLDKSDECDWCYFTCLCHDPSLAEYMVAEVDQRKRLGDSLKEWLKELNPEPHIIVSHPHGRSKYVTVGEYGGVEMDSRMCTYTTDTCPGSSGANVLGTWRGYRLHGTHHCQGGGTDRLNKGFESCGDIYT